MRSEGEKKEFGEKENILHKRFWYLHPWTTESGNWEYKKGCSFPVEFCLKSGSDYRAGGASLWKIWNAKSFIRRKSFSDESLNYGLSDKAFICVDSRSWTLLSSTRLSFFFSTDKLLIPSWFFFLLCCWRCEGKEDVVCGCKTKCELENLLEAIKV